MSSKKRWNAIPGLLLVLILVLQFAAVTALATPVCTCVEQCADNINIWCDVCGTDSNGCTGWDVAVPYALNTTVIDGRTYYEIGTADDLFAFAEMVNKGRNTINATLTADIVINPGTFDAQGNYKPKAGEEPRVWTPIGIYADDYDDEVPFMGTFLGNGHTISGLYVCNEDAKHTGLICVLYMDAVAEDIHVVNSYLKNGSYIAGVVTWNYGTVRNCSSDATVTSVATASNGYGAGGVVCFSNGTVENCKNTGAVSCDENIGGVVAFNNGIVRDCSNTGVLRGSYLGGVVGKNNETVENSTNSGIIQGGAFTGGVIGTNYGDVQSCSNTGKVTGDRLHVGGVAGYNGDEGNIVNCSNSGAVVNDYGNTGGIVGDNFWGNVINCTNTGKVTGTDQVGGVAGNNYSGEHGRGVVDGCTNTAAVTGYTDVGGIIGYNNDGRCKVNKCNNSGSVTGQENVGGIVGNNRYVDIFNCMNSGSVTCSGSYAGGIVGYNYRGPVKYCYNIGKVTASEHVGSILGYHIKDGNSIKHCYYLDSLGGIDGADVEGWTQKMTAAQFASGEVTYLLNDSKSDGELIWFQTCGQGMPAFEGKTVYCGYISCNQETPYNNEHPGADEPAHNYSEEIEINRVEATCTEAGSYDVVIVCASCGAESERVSKAIPALGHQFDAVINLCTHCGISGTKAGDANGDGTVNNVDAMLVLQYAVGLLDESRLNIAACNVNGDNSVNNVDAMLILQFAVGLIDSFQTAN